MSESNIQPSGAYSIFAKPLFFVTVLFGTMLTAVALFTPAWIHIYTGTGAFASFGLVVQSYGDWWNDKPGWEKTVVAMMFIAFIIEIVVVIWALFSCLPQCLPSLFLPVPFFTFVVSVLLVVCVALYGANIHDISFLVSPVMSDNIFNSNSHLSSQENHYAQTQVPIGNVGYSFWIAAAGMSVMIFATFFGCVTAAVSTIF